MHRTLMAALTWLISTTMAPAPAGAAEAPSPAQDILQSSGIQAGLAVHLGATDGQMEIGLTNGGRVLVHGLALDDAALERSRAAIRAAGVYGLASVEKAATPSPLPYAENLVNLLVADLDALGAKAPPMEEVVRVLAPGGAAMLRRGGAWTRTVKPRPKEMDDWTHFDYGPEGNGVSHDRLVRLPTGVQWIAGVQDIRLGGNPAGFRVYTGIRIWGGRAFFEWGSGDKSKRETFYSGRDAFNGLPLWSLRNTATGRKDWQFVAAKGRLYTFLEKGGPPVALDAETGSALQSFDQGGRLTDEPSQTALRYCEGVLLQTSGNTLYALDAGTGALKWKYVEPGGALFFPCASARDGRVFVTVCDAATRASSRWPVAKAQAILALDLATGKPVWRCAEIADFYVGQLVYDGGNLAVFASGAIGGGDQPFIGAIRTSDGKLLWHATFQKQYNRFGYNLLVRDGTIYYADAWRLYAHDMRTGAETRPFDDGGYNMRCNRFSATDNLFIYGLVAYVDRNWRGAFQSITRSGCAIGAVPANGMMYFTPNACGCITQLRGHIALSAEPLREPIPDARRLERASPGAEPAAPAPASATTEPPKGPIPEDWSRYSLGPPPPEATTTAGNITLVAVTHQHRIEARDAAGKPLWSFTAGGRVSSPILHEGLCLFGSRDGWVWGLNAATGGLVWRFMAAPYERKMVACGQLESSWPVYGMVMHGGLACCSAGLHPEAGGGIYVYGLDPKTGRLVWKKVLARAAVLYDASKRSAKVPIRPNRILNDVLKSDGQTLSLPGITFAPDEPDAEIQKKVNGEIEPPRKGA